MYWLREFQLLQIVLYLLLSISWGIGGWLLVVRLFSFKQRERLLAGIAAGWFLSISLTNLLAQLIPLDYAFAISSLGIFLAGILFNFRSHRFDFQWNDFQAWPQLIWLEGLTVVFELIQRGLALFDEFLHLPLVSVLAAGDIPPHFPVNPTMQFAYHYGIQLWAATLVRMASFTPWAAFDLAKAFSLAFTFILAWLWVRRWTRSGILAGLGSGLIGLGGGALWLLLLLPPGIALALTSTTQLVNAAADSGPNIMAAMISPWVLEGGGPFPFPFAYVNGLFSSVIFYYGSSAAFPFLMALWLLLAASRPRLHWAGGVVLGVILACLALVSESLFGPLWVSIALVAIIQIFRNKPRPWGSVGPWLIALGLSALLSITQGGYITVVFQNVLQAAQGVHLNAAYTEHFSLRWPPGIFSQKLGVLSFSDPRQVVLLLMEIGPVILVVPLVAYLTVRWYKRGNYLLAGLGGASFISLLFPAIVEYSVDPSMTRFPQMGIWLWLTLSIPGLIYWLHRSKGVGQTVLGLGAFVTTFSGFILLGVMLISIQVPQYSNGIQTVDVQASQLFWNKLPLRSQVLDSYSSRAVVVFGRGVRSNQSTYQRLPEYSALIASPNPQAVLKAGFAFVYMNKTWWESLWPSIRSSYKQPCVHLAGEWQGYQGDFRRLYDISRCQ